MSSSQHISDHQHNFQIKLIAGPDLIRFGGYLSDNMESGPNLSLEYGNLHCTVNVVESMYAATQHIVLYGGAHTETIVTENSESNCSKSAVCCILLQRLLPRDSSEKLTMPACFTIPTHDLQVFIALDWVSKIS
ncbi:hypothetical protein P879_02289 [Paragonimus westermani]|uniref:Uncharacterized protein n=1 Tax=Paragonimus westermani TaxID=34504 RepID=A0A8T0DNX9_9TREM|nr:hypothetical protein P879_02289 [Paragonimus westermani]